MRRGYFLKRYLMVLLLPALKLVYWLSGCFGRKSDVWVFGSYVNSFTDNSKYLFAYVTEKHPEITAVWITSSGSICETIRNAGGRVYARWSLAGVYYVLRAKFWFVSAYVSDINVHLSRNAVLVNLWHGVPLKTIEFDIQTGPLAKAFHSPTFLEKQLFNAHLFRRPEWVLSTSDFVTETSFSSAFQIAAERCLPFGYPRLDPFHWSPEETDKWLARWGNPSLRHLIKDLEKFDHVFIYMPTWRDANPSFVSTIGFDFQKLNEKLKQLNGVLLMKLHIATPASSLASVKGFENIVVMETKDDVYPLLPSTTALITDYSSIYIDYLCLNRPICYFVFDLESYLSGSRGFYYDFDDVTPGAKVRTANEVTAFMGANDDESKEARSELQTKLFKYNDGNASERIVRFFKSQ